jgi:hypothetical protein
VRAPQPEKLNNKIPKNLGLIGKIRYNIARKNLRDNHRKLIRNRKSFNLETARYIALLYHLPDEDSYKRIDDFIRMLSEKGIKVKVACYTLQKFVPHYFIPKLLQDIFTFKEVNWKYIPVKPFVKDFLEEEYDILIDLSLLEHLPLLYLAANCKAGLKIGRFDENNQDFFDLMIELPANATLEYFIGQVTHYLNKINKEPQ